MKIICTLWTRQTTNTGESTHTGKDNQQVKLMIQEKTNLHVLWAHTRRGKAQAEDHWGAWINIYIYTHMYIHTKKPVVDVAARSSCSSATLDTRPTCFSLPTVADHYLCDLNHVDKQMIFPILLHKNHPLVFCTPPPITHTSSHSITSCSSEWFTGVVVVKMLKVVDVWRWKTQQREVN